MISNKVSDQTTPHMSSVQRLIDTLGGELQKAVEREEMFALYNHDVVAPLILRGTDIAKAVDQQALLE